MTTLHLNIYASVPSSHHYILGSVSTFKYDDLSALKHVSPPPHLKSAKKGHQNKLTHLYAVANLTTKTTLRVTN